jgi:hypothetical protein
MTERKLNQNSFYGMMRKDRILFGSATHCYVQNIFNYMKIEVNHICFESLNNDVENIMFFFEEFHVKKE